MDEKTINMLGMLIDAERETQRLQDIADRTPYPSAEELEAEADEFLDGEG